MVRIGIVMAVMSMCVSCNTLEHVGSDSTAGKEVDRQNVLFQDPMTDNWQANWFLDGKNAVLEHRDGGLSFITTASKVDKRVDRAAFDAQHAVLWTKKEFEGDVRISYDFSKLPDSSWQKLIYIQARGIGEERYVEDIYAWRDLREVARMDKYYKFMDLISLSLRSEIRCKRYPIVDMENNRLECEFMPRAENKGMAEGREYQCLVEKRRASILLRIKDVRTGEHVVDHTWDLTDQTILENRDPKFVGKGRIGLRLMGGHKINFRDFTVERLEQ